MTIRTILRRGRRSRSVRRTDTITTSSARAVLTDQDAQRLGEVVLNQPSPRFGEATESLDALICKLGCAAVVESVSVPSDVITMDSSVQCRDVDSGERLVCTLSWPDHADADRGAVSVLAPVGTALLGARVGEVVLSRVPVGVRRLRVEKIRHGVARLVTIAITISESNGLPDLAQ